VNVISWGDIVLVLPFSEEVLFVDVESVSFIANAASFLVAHYKSSGTTMYRLFSYNCPI
jgi:hypothetical protein